MAIRGKVISLWSDFRIAHLRLQVAPQHERGRALARPLLVVGGAAANLAKAGTRIKPARRRIVLIDLEEHRARAEALELTQMQIEQACRKSAAAARGRDGNG